MQAASFRGSRLSPHAPPFLTRPAAQVDVPATFRQYHLQRMMRASAIHGMAGMAAFMASTYKAYLGEGFPGPLEQVRGAWGEEGRWEEGEGVGRSRPRRSTRWCLGVV